MRRRLCDGIPIVCVAGAVLAVPLGYLGILLNHDGLVTLAAVLAFPFTLLLSLPLLYLPFSLLWLIWFVVKKWLIAKIWCRGSS